MEKEPLISIALCTYNGEKYIREQMESLIGQTYSNLEIIIVDDHSTDDTVKILESYKKENIKIYYNEKNIGFNKNFEKALRLCKGIYIAISDQDDIWEKDKIEILFKNIGDKMMVYSNSMLIDAEGKTIRKRFKKLMPPTGDPRQFSIRNYVAGHTLLLKKDFLSYVLPIPSNCFYDWWFAINAANEGSVCCIDRCLTKQRFHGNNSSAEKNTGNDEKYISMSKWIDTVLKIKDLQHRSFFNRLFFILKIKNRTFRDLNLLAFQIWNFRKIYNFRNWLSNLNEARKIILSDIPA